jgi:hypothetical protein
MTDSFSPTRNQGYFLRVESFEITRQQKAEILAPISAIPKRDASEIGCCDG